MKAAAFALETLTGYEEQLATLKSDIKEHLNNNNNEGETSREDQAQALLQTVAMNIKATNSHKSNLRHHQERVERFWGKYRKVCEEIEDAYEELTTLGWTQMSDHESDIPEAQ
eukprot:12612448-Heterocapsa_arctica.AAC.1